MTREMAAACAARTTRNSSSTPSRSGCRSSAPRTWAVLLDILKDRLYTAGKASRARRSAQTALHHVTQVLLRLMAPILSFTAEEAWEVVTIPGNGRKRLLPHLERVAVPEEPELLERWGDARAARPWCRSSSRRFARPGPSALRCGQAEVSPRPALPALVALGEDLRFVLITSKAAVRGDPTRSSRRRARIPSASAAGTTAPTSAPTAPPTICGRCVSNLEGPGETRRFA